eukprot:TRINITY_DN112447_c0_g1_i1.p1 TRINITY_DN112447_c0_g1~~TRINITY_DN112447_c0_g1_i1.p1  ORF type:complete len:548 (+),score=89.92 TRINITY_DN112447_c0_g1_i1:108-1751(+)
MQPHAWTPTADETASVDEGYVTMIWPQQQVLVPIAVVQQGQLVLDGGYAVACAGNAVACAGNAVPSAGGSAAMVSAAPVDLQPVLVPVMPTQGQFVNAPDCFTVDGGNFRQQMQFVPMMPYHSHTAGHAFNAQAAPFAPTSCAALMVGSADAACGCCTTEEQADAQQTHALFSARSTADSSHPSVAVDATPRPGLIAADDSACPTPVKLSAALSVASSESTKGSETRRRRRKRGAKAVAASASLDKPRASEKRTAAPLPAGSLQHAAGEMASAVVVDARWCQSLLQDLEGANGDRAPHQLRGSVCVLAFDAAGCRVVQKALEVLGMADCEAIVMELHGHVVEAMRSPHANFVIQKVVELMPAATAGFVAEELSAIGCEAARHRYGCRILCRILEHTALREEGVRPSLNKAKKLIDEVVSHAATLCHHAFAHHVMDSIVEHGTAEMRHFVATALRSNLVQNAKNRYASYVVERSMTYCSPMDQHAYVHEFLQDTEELFSLASHEYGSHVLRTMMQLPCEATVQVRYILRAGADRLQASKYGRRVLEML